MKDKAGMAVSPSSGSERTDIASFFFFFLYQLLEAVSLSTSNSLNSCPCFLWFQLAVKMPALGRRSRLLFSHEQHFPTMVTNNLCHDQACATWRHLTLWVSAAREEAPMDGQRKDQAPHPVPHRSSQGQGCGAQQALAAPKALVHVPRRTACPRGSVWMLLLAWAAVAGAFTHRCPFWISQPAFLP